MGSFEEGSRESENRNVKSTGGHITFDRRDEFIKVNGSAEFAHNFCPTRWTENQPVAEKALKLWEKYIEIIEYFIKTPKAQPKNNRSYDTLCNHIKDKMMKCRFQGFIDIASFLNKFLKMYQTDAPMVPFMADDLECLTRRLLKCVVKKSVLDKAITPFSVNSINLFSDKKKNSHQ